MCGPFSAIPLACLEAITVYAERVGALTDPGCSAIQRRWVRTQPLVPCGGNLACRTRGLRARIHVRATRSKPPTGNEASNNTETCWPVSPDSRKVALPVGTSAGNTGAWAEAYQHYVAARDLDGMPMRCLTSFQQAYHDVAARHDCAVVDGQAVFHAIGPHGLVDDTLFHDAMHPSLRGHIALASEILDSVARAANLRLAERCADAGDRRRPVCRSLWFAVN